jgi:4-amino-4-deoxy-L-arabinose transferase-like glycosyltransferase
MVRGVPIIKINRFTYRVTDLALGIPTMEWLWLLALAVWRLAIASRHGLGADEAHYALYGLRLDWSYFDHPPLVGWVNAVFIAIFGANEIAVRIPAVVCGFISSIQMFKLCLRAGHSERAARWAIVALNAMFIPAALWMMLLPDTLLLVLVFWLVKIALDLVENPRPRDWIELGFNLDFLCRLSSLVLPMGKGLA